MAKPLRACPICKNCGNKKFSILQNKPDVVVLECKKCFMKMEI